MDRRHVLEIPAGDTSTAACAELDGPEPIGKQHILLAALQDAKNESAARARMMATIGHDLRQPLQAAILVIDRVKGAVDPAASTRLDLALAMLARLGGELGQLARASEDAPVARPHLRAFPVAGLLDPLCAEWSEHAAASGVVLRVRPSALRVVSDEAMLSTILRNLVGNAIKFSPRGGRVLVGCRRRAGGLQLQVLDNGPGIPADKVQLVFQAFHRLDLAEPREGLGLGLSIVRRTAAALGHTLELRTAPGAGSRFGVNVPLAAPAHGAGGTAIAAMSGTGDAPELHPG